MSIPPIISSSLKYRDQDYTITIKNDNISKNERRLRICQKDGDKYPWKATVKVIETQKNGKTKIRYLIYENHDKETPLESIKDTYLLARELIKEYHAKNSLAGRATILIDGSNREDDEAKNLIRNLLRNGWTFHEKTSDEFKFSLAEAIRTNHPIPNFVGSFKCICEDKTIYSQLLSDKIWDKVKNLPALTPRDTFASTPASIPTVPPHEPTPSTEGKKIPPLTRNSTPGVFNKIFSGIKYVFLCQWIADLYDAVKKLWA